MKELGLLELLRYALSGGIGMAVLLLTFPCARLSVRGMEDTKEATIVLGSVLLIGTIVYNVHRAMIFPFFLRSVGFVARNRRFSLGRLVSFWRPSDEELAVDRWRWPQCERLRKRWDEWGAQTHSLYCAAWAIAASLLVGRAVWGPHDPRA
jgi:hypothetical protein